MTTSPADTLPIPHVLIVDDDASNRTLLAVILEQEGFTIARAADGIEALRMIAERPPDLILLDVMMPVVNGIEVLSRIKHDPATKHIPVIMITALDDRTSRMLALSAGAEDFLTKPVDRAELCVRVRNLWRLKAYADRQDRYGKMLEGEVRARTADLVERAKTLELHTSHLAAQAALLDLAHDAIIVRDMSGCIVFWSRGAEVMYGWSSTEAVGRDPDELLQTERSASHAGIVSAVLSDGRWEGELAHRTRDGTRVVVASRWALQRSADGTPSQILTINNDITARKLAEADRLLLTERLSLATTVAKFGVWEWDLGSDTLTWDATMFEIYGIAPAVMLPFERWAAAVLPEDLPVVTRTLRKVIEEGGRTSADFRIVRKDGSVRHVSMAATVVLNEHADVTRVIGVDKDVTERTTAAAALEQRGKDHLQFKDDFLSHVSHELRSPLTAIKQFTMILLAGLAGELNPEQRRFEEIVLKNIRQLQSMIDDLLEVTRLETGKLTVERDSVSVAATVADILDTLQGTARAKGLTVSSELPVDLPAAYADATRLRQILIILVDNAIKFTPEGGSVQIRARLQPSDRRFLLLEVSDTGCGISPDLIGKLFDRLYQASSPIVSSRQGLGLGLYICKELVTRQGGEISVDGTKTGSTFAFTIPVSSLETVIAPLLKSNRWPAQSVALVRVETSLPGVWPSQESREDWSNEARAILQRSLLPELDVLLPRRNFDPEENQSFFIVAFSDQKGAFALTNRIREHFERHTNLKQIGMAVSVSYKMLPAASRNGKSSATEIVEDMANTLEQSINSYVPVEAYAHA